MKILVVYSGGLDSTSLLFELKRLGHQVRSLSVNYGQRHSKELQAAAKIAHEAEISHETANLVSLRPLLGGSSQTDTRLPVPEGHYTDETMKLTVVPNRNMILLAVAAARAISSKCEAIAYAAHAGDHAIYPDCRPDFTAAMETALKLCDWSPIDLLRPFINMTKADIVKIGTEAKAPLKDTWSCYKGGKVHCGKCGTCVERIEAFKLAGISDPTVYEKEKN